MGSPALPADCPEDAFAAALASLPSVGPAWLARTLGCCTPRQAWELVLDGALRLGPSSSRTAPVKDARRQARQAEQWAVWARDFDVEGLWRKCRSDGVSVLWPLSPGFPARLSRGSFPVGVLFVAGAVNALTPPASVAIVGTRDCSAEGARTAYRMGYELAEAGVCVVSGLALGIDGAAHSGAIGAMKDLGQHGLTVGVAASGVDVVYPRAHGALWREVQRTGAVVSEAAMGSAAQNWRFPARNRVIAGLVDLVVVVECHMKSGTWHTVDAALDRSTEVVVVPGPVWSPCCSGSNQLLYEGATPVRHAQDILDVLGRAQAGEPCAPPDLRTGRGHVPRHPTLSPQVTESSVPVELALDLAPANAGRSLGQLGELAPVGEAVLRALSSHSMCLDDLVERSGLRVTAVAVALQRLADVGLVTEAEGWWSRQP